MSSMNTTWPEVLQSWIENV